MAIGWRNEGDLGTRSCTISRHCNVMIDILIVLVKTTILVSDDITAMKTITVCNLLHRSVFDLVIQSSLFFKSWGSPRQISMFLRALRTKIFKPLPLGLFICKIT